MNLSTFIVAAIICGLAFVALYFVLRLSEIEKRVYSIRDRGISGYGFIFWREQGVRDVAFESIAAGLKETFNRARCAGYDKALAMSCYTIAILRPDTLDSIGQGAIKIGDGLVTGIGVDFSAEDDNLIAIAAQTTPEAWQLVAQYESEHAVLRWNDEAKYQATHGKNDKHPLLEVCSDEGVL